jgi:hypothetical protein
MESERALKSLEQVRSSLDGELAEMADSLAILVKLQQDIRSPMLGAKVTLYLRPDTDIYKVPSDEIPEHIEDWQVSFTSDDKEYWGSWDFEWYNGEPDNEPEEVAKIKIKKDQDSPDLVEHKAIVIEGNVAESAPEGELWDPNEEEYRLAEDYPMGTVNCVIPKEYHSDEILDFEEDYASDVKVVTSVTPVKDEPEPNKYTPGW